MAHYVMKLQTQIMKFGSGNLSVLSAARKQAHPKPSSCCPQSFRGVALSRHRYVFPPSVEAAALFIFKMSFCGASFEIRISEILKPIFFRLKFVA
jgi:hypothetical protein